ncbi:MAG: STAS-like domain-containing protein [Cyanobacteria bacterium J06627_28]
MELKIHEITGEYAISSDAGQRIYEQIQPALLDGGKVELDFSDVKVFVSAFFNLAIGQLLKDISGDDLNQLLTLSNLNPSGAELLKTIIANAKQYYSDAERKKAVDTAIGEYAVSFEG